MTLRRTAGCRLTNWDRCPDSVLSRWKGGRQCCSRVRSCNPRSYKKDRYLTIRKLHDSGVVSTRGRAEKRPVERLGRRLRGAKGIHTVRAAGALCTPVQLPPRGACPLFTVLLFLCPTPDITILCRRFDDKRAALAGLPPDLARIRVGAGTCATRWRIRSCYGSEIQ